MSGFRSQHSKLRKVCTKPRSLAFLRGNRKSRQRWLCGSEARRAPPVGRRVWAPRAAAAPCPRSSPVWRGTPRIPPRGAPDASGGASVLGVTRAAAMTAPGPAPPPACCARLLRSGHLSVRPLPSPTARPDGRPDPRFPPPRVTRPGGRRLGPGTPPASLVSLMNSGCELDPFRRGRGWTL